MHMYVWMDVRIERGTERVGLHESGEESYGDFYFCFRGELDAPHGGHDWNNKEELEASFDGCENGPTSHLKGISERL